MTALERLAVRVENAQPQMLESLLLDAEGMLLAYTGRSILPPALETAQIQLAALLYNRMGAEGESAHSEGGVSRTMEALPADIQRQIAPYRLAKVVNCHASDAQA